jgi:hypothetical protein
MTRTREENAADLAADDERKKMARSAAADKLRTMAAELDDLAADLHGFAVVSSNCDWAADHLRLAAQLLSPLACQCDDGDPRGCPLHG